MTKTLFFSLTGAAALAAALGLAASSGQAQTSGAAPAAKPAQSVAPAKGKLAQCFTARQIRGYAELDPDTVVIRTGASDYYALHGLTGCGDLDFANHISIQVRGGGPGFICDALDAEVVIPATYGPQRCPIASINQLTPVEVAALPNNKRP